MLGRLPQYTVLAICVCHMNYIRKETKKKELDRNKTGISDQKKIFARVKILITIALRFFSVPALISKNSPIFPPVCPQRGRAEERKSCNFPTP